MSEKVEKATLVSDYIQSGFPILSVCSREPDRTEDRIVSEIDSLVEFMRGRLRKTDPAAAARYTFTVYAWDCRRGRRDLSGNGTGNDPDMMDPFSLLQWFSSEECGERNVLLIHNFHRQIGEDLGIIQHLQNIVPILKTSLRTIIFVSPDMDVPVELERIVTEIDFPLPTAEEIKEEFIKMADEYKQDINEADLDEAVEVAKGLTMFEAENAVSLSIIRSMGIDKETIFEVKSQMIKKNGDLEISSFDETLDSLKGYQNLKEFGLEVLSHPLSRGILLLGVSGCGKSHYAKAIGKAIGMPTVSLSFGNMFDSLVGSSERKIKQALQICDAMSPLLLFIDELEKDLAGAQSSGETDSGVTKRVMKTFLTWLSDHKSRVPIIATANSVKYVPPEFLRAERWDAIFFVNVPTEEESEAILQHYLTVYDIKASVEEVRAKINMRNWTGAEIETLCRLGHIMGGDIEKSSKYVVPIYSAKKAEIDELRAEALQYAIPASGALDNAVKSVREPSPTTRQLIQGSSGGKSTVKLSKKKKTDGSVN
jgi:AAA+ superfamily predicted ATPase